ncbi:C2 family cysteine protease [Nocardia salmonicida]|uniref:WXG100-like domain-containing protein n=1 Tax=Nocardia salmonicida TaxID=53431 RepID=UPI00367C9C1E
MAIPDAVRQSDINLPEELHWLSWVAGGAWPEGSEGGMFALADAWSEAQSGLTGLVSSIDDAVDDILSAYPSAGDGSAMSRTLRNLTDESDSTSLQAIAKSLGQLSDSCDKVGCSIQQNKIMIIAGLVQLVYEIAVAWLFPPTAPAAQAALILWYEILFQFLKQLLRQMLVAALKAMGQQVALTLAIQLGQMAAGHRDGIDGKDVWYAALGGALGGAFGAAFGKLGGDLFKFLGGKITRSQFDKRWQQLLVGAAEGGIGGVGGMIGGGVANQIINGGDFHLDPRMLGAGAAGALSSAGSRWRGAGGANVHIDEVGGPRSLDGSVPPPAKVPPSAPDIEQAAPREDGSGTPNSTSEQRAGGSRADDSSSEHRSGSSTTDHGDDSATVTSPRTSTSEGDSAQHSTSAPGKNSGEEPSAPGADRSHAHEGQPEIVAPQREPTQQHADAVEPTSPQGDDGQPVPQAEPTATAPQHPAQNAAASSQHQASNAAAGDKSVTAQRVADGKVPAGRDNATMSPKDDIVAAQPPRAQPRSDGALDAPESVRAEQGDSAVAAEPDQLSSAVPHQRGEFARPEDVSASPHRTETPAGNRPNPENSAAAPDKTTPVKDKESRNRAPAPRETASEPARDEPRARAGSGGAKGVSDDLALVGKVDEATGRRWRLVDRSLLDPAWPGGKTFLREILGFEHTIGLLRGDKSPHEGREMFRQFRDGDLPLRPGFGQKKLVGAADEFGDGAVGGAVRGHDEPSSRGVFRFNTDELPDFRYTVDDDGVWRKTSDGGDDGGSTPGRTEPEPVDGTRESPVGTRKNAEPESEVIPRKGGTTIDVPRQGPVLKRWAEMSAPAMRTVVGDHDGNWYISKDFQHEQFHNSGVYVAFQAHFVNGKMVAVHDWAGAYHPSPTRVKAALDKLGLYGNLDHYDQQGRKYTDADRENWTPAADPSPTAKKDVPQDVPQNEDSIEHPAPTTRDSSDGPPRDFRAEAEDISRMYKREDWEDVSPDDLKEALRGSIHHNARDADGIAKYHRAVAAAVETIRRGTTKFDDDGAEAAPGKTLRWTQIMGTMGMRDGPINMDAGEGKTFVFLADSILKASAGDSVHVFTTRDTLANDAVNLYEQVLRALGPDVFDVVRMTPNGPDETGIDPARPTIYIGTLDDAGFGQLRGKVMRGDTAVIDELDEALYYADTTWIISDGPSLPADPRVAARLLGAQQFLDKRLGTGELGPQDFGRTAEQTRGSAKLTEEGTDKVLALLADENPGASRADLADMIDRVNSAAAVRWEFVENDHYIVHRGGAGGDKVYIINQTTHKVMFDPATSTESRWNGGLAQAIEAAHGITIRGDSTSSQSLTAEDMFAQRYLRLSGASGTAEGVSSHLVDNYGMREVTSVPRFTESKLETYDASLAPSQSAKHDAIADAVSARHSADARPELVLANRNSEVAEISARLTALGIAHEAIDARWFITRGPTAEADLAVILDQAGQLGKVLVINRQGGRGVDIGISDAVSAAGGLHVSISGKSDVRDIDVQAENRAARNGQEGSVEYFLAADDALYATAPHHAETVVRYTDAVTAQEQTAAGLREAEATRDLAEGLDATTGTAQTRVARDAALADYDAALRAHRAATAAREAAEAAVKAAAPLLQAENAVRRMSHTVVAPNASADVDSAAPELSSTPDREGVLEREMDVERLISEEPRPATEVPHDQVTEGDESPRLPGDEQSGLTPSTEEAAFDSAVRGPAGAHSMPYSMPTAPTMPLTVVDLSGLFVADVSGHLVAVGTEELVVSRTIEHEQDLVHEIQLTDSSSVLLHNALVEQAFTTNTRDDGTRVVSASATGVHVLAGASVSVPAAGSVYGRADPLDSTKMSLYGGPRVGWLSVDANRTAVTSRRATGPLFYDGVANRTDLEHGTAEDSPLRAKLLEWVTEDADSITDMISMTVLGDARTFTVRFFDEERNGWALITVDDTFYANSRGELPYGVDDESRALWPAVIEKAWAVFRDSNHTTGPTVWFADPVSRDLGRQLAELSDKIKGEPDQTRHTQSVARRAALTEELAKHFAGLPARQRDIAIERARQLGSIDRHIAALAAHEEVSLEAARAAMRAELVEAFAGKDIAVRICEESLLDVLDDGRFKTAFDLGETGAGVNSRAMLEARWFGHDVDRHPLDGRAVYGYVRIGDEQPIGAQHEDRLNAYGDTVVVLKSEVRARTTVCVGDSIGNQANVYPSALDNPAPESFGVYPAPRSGRPSAHVGLRRDLTQIREWGYVEAQVHGGITSADIDHVVFRWEPGTVLRDKLRAAGIPWKVLAPGAASLGGSTSADHERDFAVVNAGEHLDLPSVGSPEQVDAPVSSGWETYLNSSRVSDNPDALRGKNFLGVAVSFTYDDVVTQELIGPAGTAIGVSYKHVEAEIEAGQRWAGAQQWHDKVVRTQPGQTGEQVFAGVTRIGQEVVAAPWASEYAGVGKEPIFVNAHAGPNTFEIRLRTGTTLEVSGATFAKLVEQSAPLRSVLVSGGPSSVVLIACEVAKGSAATDFATTLHKTFPAAPVHAAGTAVWISNWRDATARAVRYRYLAADNNAGWVTLHNDGTRTEHASTRYPTGATASSTGPGTLVGSNSLASGRDRTRELIDSAVSSPLATTADDVLDASERTVFETSGIRADSAGWQLVGPSVSSGWRTYLNSLRVSGDPEALRGKNFLELPVNFVHADVVVHELIGPTGTAIGVSFQHVESHADTQQRWARAQQWHDKVVRTQPGQTGKEAFAGATRIGQEVVAAPWASELATTGKNPVFVNAHAGPDAFEIRLRTGTTIEVSGATFATIVERSRVLRATLETGGPSSVVLIACKVGKGSAARDFAATLHKSLPSAPIHAAATPVWTSVMRNTAAPNVNFRLLAADRNAGWVTLHNNGTRTEHASTRYPAATAASTVVAGSRPTGTSGLPVSNASAVGAAPRTDLLATPLRSSAGEDTDEMDATAAAEAAANEARMRQWLIRNTFDDAFDRAVGGRTLRDGTDSEESADLEGMSEDARNPAPGAGLLTDTVEHEWGEGVLTRLFAEPDTAVTESAANTAATGPEYHRPSAQALAALPVHIAPAAEATVLGDRCVLVDGLGTAHRLGVGSGWRTVKEKFTDPGTGVEYVGLVPFDQTHDASPIRVSTALLATVFEKDAGTFFWETTYYLARAGIGIDGSDDARLWLPPGSTVAVRPAEHSDGTTDFTRTVFGRPKGATWHTVDSHTLGPLVPELRRSDSPLWHDSGPDVLDARQGALGNCFLVANMMALARSPLPLLTEMMTDLGDSVAVRFFDKDGAEVWVRVSKDLYVNSDNSTRYAADSGVLWPAILEKAYAVFSSESGYAGLDGGSPGTTAAAMMPAVLTAGTRHQPSRAVTDAYFLHPMRMDRDELHSMDGGTAEFAHAIVGLRAQWEEQVRLHRQREARPMDAVVDRARILALTANNNNDVWAAVREFYRLIGPDNPASTEGFRRFLDQHLSPEQRTRWAVNIARLVEIADAATSWRTREADPHMGRHVAERLDYALARGDLVMLGTRNWGRDDTVRVPGLAGAHGYVVLGVDRDTNDLPTALRLRNPWGHHNSAPSPLPGIVLHAAGEVQVDLRHLNKFVTLAICGSGARGLFGLDQLAPPGVEDHVHTPNQQPLEPQSADEPELAGIELPVVDEADADPISHVSHPIGWKKHLGAIGRLFEKKPLSGTAQHKVVRFNAKGLIQEPIVDHEGHTVGVTFLYGTGELEVLRNWGAASNGHGMVFRTEPGEPGIAALAGDPSRLGLDRFVPAPWRADGAARPFYVSVHADSHGFEVRTRAGRSIVVDGTTFAAIVQASPTFHAASKPGSPLSIVMIACAIATGSSGTDFSTALRMNFPEYQVYGSRGDVDVYAANGLDVGLLAAGNNTGWMSYLRDGVTDHATTRYDNPELSAANGRTAFIEDTMANGMDIGDWVDQLRSTEGFFREEPYFAVTNDHRVVGFFGADVIANPMFDHHGHTIGVNFHDPAHLADEQLWARTQNFHSVVTKMRDDDNDLGAVAQRIVATGSFKSDVVNAPWAAEYNSGRNGPVYISAHADENVFEINLRSGVKIDIDGATYASIVQSTHPFREALVSGVARAANQPKSFVLVSCKAAAGPAGTRFAEVLGASFPNSRIYASTGTVNLHVSSIAEDDPENPTRISWLGASHNAGWMSYQNGGRITYQNTRHPPSAAAGSSANALFGTPDPVTGLPSSDISPADQADSGRDD